MNKKDIIELIIIKLNEPESITTKEAEFIGQDLGVYCIPCRNSGYLVTKNSELCEVVHGCNVCNKYDDYEARLQAEYNGYDLTEDGEVLKKPGV